MIMTREACSVYVRIGFFSLPLVKNKTNPDAKKQKSAFTSGRYFFILILR